MSVTKPWISAVVFAVVALLVAPAAGGKRVPASKDQVQMSFAPLVKKAAPAVVNIFTRKVMRRRAMAPLFDDPFFRRFFGEGFGFGIEKPRAPVQNSLGSGVIVRADGLVITNHHVIEGADEITVVLADRREFEARIVGTDKRTDLAVLRLDTGGEALPHLELHDSDDLEVGDLVLAIGNPFGVGQTVTSGIVSALARTQVGKSDLRSFIQTDAAINPGNSGGALIGMDGKLVGINSAIFSKSGGSLGIGFAIPSNMVRTVIAGITDGGRLVRPWLGAWGQGVDADIAASLGLARPAGVLVNGVHPAGPADRAGVRVGDVLLAINGHGVDDPESLKYRIATLAVGGTAELTVWRRGKSSKIRVALAPPPEDPPRALTELRGPHPLSGATVANMSPALADELGLETIEAGVIVMGLRPGSSASRLGFRTGDMVRAVNGEHVDSVRRLRTLVAAPADRWRITLQRDGRTLNMVVNR
ncbi:MAG: Do family serine endopeptidase [Rhodospirillales bacterium]